MCACRMNEVLHLVRRSGGVTEGAPVSSSRCFRGNVRHHDASILTTDACELGVGRIEISHVAEHQATPRHVERCIGEGQGTYVCSRDTLGAGLRQHLDGEVDANGKRGIAYTEPSRRSAADVEQPTSLRRDFERRNRLAFEMTHRRLGVVERRPETIRGPSGKKRAHLLVPLWFVDGARRWPYACESSGTRCASRR